MNAIDLSSFSPNDMVKPYWGSNLNIHSDGQSQSLGIKVYLSTNNEFNADFVIDEFVQKKKDYVKLYNSHASREEKEENVEDKEQLPRKRFARHDSILLWEESTIPSPSLSKSFILSTSSVESAQQSPSFQHAIQYLDEADKKVDLMSGESNGGSSDAINTLLSNTGDGIETTSIILSLYKGITKTFLKIMTSLNGQGEDDNERVKKEKQKQDRTKNRIVLPISKSSSIWSHLMKNSTVYVHVILTRNFKEDEIETTTTLDNQNFEQTLNNLRMKQSSYNLIASNTKVVKHDLPNHITKPKRFLFKDLFYFIQKLLTLIDDKEPAPWQMEYTKPKEYQIYQSSLIQKDNQIGYPYFKPEMAVKLVSDDVHYPLQYVGASGMEVIRVGRNKGEHVSGYAYLPGLYVDEMGLTSEKYIPLNETVDALPLRISFDSGIHKEGGSTGGLSPGRWRLLSHLSQSLESQKELGFDQTDIDDVRRLVADTNVTLLAITIFASTLHLLFEFLTFKNDVEFWSGNKDLTGLSVRALFMDFFSQFIILLFLIEKGSSLLMTIPAAAGCAIALWKCQKGAGFRFIKTTTETLHNPSVSIWNKFFRLFGYELHAMRLRTAAALMADGTDKPDSEKDLATLTEEMDRLATNTIGKYLLLPLVLGYTFHTLVNEEHSGWYSWLITSASAVVYGVGFVMMTPQLFLNYKLKSVAHLPWRVLGYRFVNTFIDDLFAMIIRMPTMARISCFRDDIVFIIYLWQRYLYPVDASRPVEGGGMDAVSQAATTAVINDKDKDGKKKTE